MCHVSESIDSLFVAAIGVGVVSLDFVVVLAENLEARICVLLADERLSVFRNELSKRRHLFIDVGDKVMGF